MVPHQIIYKYISLRYGKDEFCDYPFDQSMPSIPIKNSTKRSSEPASHIEVALSNWYIPLRQRAQWATLFGKGKGHGLTTNGTIHNLKAIEIENSIASPPACVIDSNQVIP